MIGKRMPPTQRQLLALLGEIDCIRLEGSHERGMTVVIELCGRRVEVIKDNGEIVHHTVTRFGIGEILRDNGVGYET